MKGTLKDKVTNITGILLAVAGIVTQIVQPIQDGLESATDLNWMTILLVVGGVLVSFFTGKDSNGKPKT